MRTASSGKHRTRITLFALGATIFTLTSNSSTKNKVTDSGEKASILIYGAQGKLGRTVTKKALLAGFTPVLAGRNAQGLVDMAREYNLTARIFELKRHVRLQEQLQGIGLVVNTAGPFEDTAKPLIRAVMAEGCDYIDANSSYPLTAWIFGQHEYAKQTQVSILPSLGIQATAADCLGSLMKTRLPDLTRLRLGLFYQEAATLGRTMDLIDCLSLNPMQRSGGEVTSNISTPHAIMEFEKRRRTKSACLQATSDLEVLWHSSRLPHVQTFLQADIEKVGFLKWLPRVGWRALRWSWLRRLIYAWLSRALASANEDQLAASSGCSSKVLCEAENAAGKHMVARVMVPDIYTSTAELLVAAMTLWKTHDFPKGVHTPSSILGKEALLNLPGVRIEEDAPAS